MNVEKTFYYNENDYNKDIYGEFEQDIQKYIQEYSAKDYSQIINKDKRTNIVSIFSEMRTNIIKWYPFEPNKRILEVGANYGEITYELSKKCRELTVIEFSEKKINCIVKRLENQENLKCILCTNLKETKIDEKYDYITLIGISEYAEKIGFKNLEDMLKWAQSHLTEDGKIILAIDNKFGVKFLAGSTRNKNEEKFANYREHINTDYKLYGKEELKKILKNIEGTNYKFYYPVPNYRLTHLIYTDNYLPQNINYNIYYDDFEEILFEELSFMKEVIKNDKFDFFTNSYLIEISKNKVCDISFVNYSNMRKEEYKIITKIAPDKVIKEAYKTEGIKHIKQIQRNIKRLKELDFTTCEEINENQIISPYISICTMDEYLKRILLLEDNPKKFLYELDKWYEYLMNKIPKANGENTIFEKYSIEVKDKNELKFLKDGFIDLIFQNVFYNGEQYILFDQEWYDVAVPLEFILYRSIKQLFFLHKELEYKINKDEIYVRYNIKKYINEFERLEESWQKDIVDEEILSFYSKKWSRIISVEDIKFRNNQELGKVYLEKDKLQLELNKLQIEDKKIRKELEDLKNGSRFYRWTKFLKKG